MRGGVGGGGGGGRPAGGGGSGRRLAAIMMVAGGVKAIWDMRKKRKKCKGIDLKAELAARARIMDEAEKPEAAEWMRRGLEAAGGLSSRTRSPSAKRPVPKPPDDAATAGRRRPGTETSNVEGQMAT